MTTIDVPIAQEPGTGRFVRGNGGGGRKPGSRNRKLLFWSDLETKAQDAVEAIVDKLIEAAKAGDMKAADLFLSRTWVAPRGRKLPVKLPDITNSAGLAAAYAATASALSRGIIDPYEAVQVGQLLEGQRRNLEGSDVLQRLKLLEARQRDGGHE